jgi:CBS-domain-containing membrane protein
MRRLLTRRTVDTRVGAFALARRTLCAAPPSETFWQKCRGQPGTAPPPRPALHEIGVSGALSATGIGSLSLLHYWVTDSSDLTMILGSFGASAVLLYAAPTVPLSQPRHVVGGHLLSAAVGVACHEFVSVPLGTPALSAPLAVSSAIMLMQLTRTLHPPAGGTTLIAVLGSDSLHSLGIQLLVPTGIGASALVLVALGNNLAQGRRYPTYWW